MFDISANQSVIVNIMRGGGPLSVINSVISPRYGIYYSTSSAAGRSPFTPTSYIGVEYSDGAMITTAPLERGGYTSLNKIKRPGELRVTFTVEGWSGFSGSLPNLTNFSYDSRSGVLAILDQMISGTDLYDIETPDKTFINYDLVGYDYSIRDGRGITLLTVQAIFEEVQENADISTESENVDRTVKLKNSTAQSAVVTEVTQVKTSAPSMMDISKAVSGIRRSVSGKFNEIIKNGSDSVVDLISRLS